MPKTKSRAPRRAPIDEPLQSRARDSTQEWLEERLGVLPELEVRRDPAGLEEDRLLEDRLGLGRPALAAQDQSKAEVRPQATGVGPNRLAVCRLGLAVAAQPGPHVGPLAEGLRGGHLLLGQDRDRLDLDEQVVSDQTRDLDERAGGTMRPEVFLAGHVDLLAIGDVLEEHGHFARPPRDTA